MAGSTAEASPGPSTRIVPSVAGRRANEAWALSISYVAAWVADPYPKRP
jgi:hypothetical protein